MLAGQIAARLTCFALLSSIETDLRDILIDEARRAGRQELLSPALRATAQERFAKATSAGQKSANVDVQQSEVSDFELLVFSDIGDVAQILHTYASDFWPTHKARITAIAKRLSSLVAVRNRVAHSRPLESDDFISVFDFANELLSTSEPLGWKHLHETMAKLNTEPSFVFRLAIPDNWAPGLNSIPNNLPTAEFDDTGFIGRATDRSLLSKLLISSHPIITIVGEGGIGKTAIALRCLYDLFDLPNAPFDLIVWVSLKARMLTISGAVEIRDAITSAMELVSKIETEILGRTEPAIDEDDGNLSAAEASRLRTLESILGDIAQQLSQRRVLLAIDNLETLSDFDILRPLLTSVAAKSKILITSRLGLGELEQRFQLKPMETRSASDLLRKFARLLGQERIASEPSSIVEQYCGQLHCNPLMIKWFVSAIAYGADSATLLDRRGESFKGMLRFCFENLFERLSVQERRLLHVFASARRSLSRAELFYLSGDADPDGIEVALGTLQRSSMLRNESARTDTSALKQNGATPNSTNIITSSRYALTETASEFIAALAPPPHELFSSVQQRMTELRRLSEHESARATTYRFDIMAVRAETPDERIGAAFLRRALDAAAAEDMQTARRSVEDARRLLPRYSEVHRISGVVEGPHDAYRALSDYETAIELDPTSSIIRFSYANFLSRYMDNHAEAIEQLLVVEQTEPDEPAVLGLHANALMRLGRYAEAASIHERLAPHLPSRDRKWRIQARTQAADCYRRWAEQTCRMLDYESAVRRLLSACGILADGFSKHDFDEQTIKIALQVADEFMYASIRCSHSDAASNVDKVIFLLEQAVQADFRGNTQTLILGNLDAFRQRLVALGEKGILNRLDALPLRSAEQQLSYSQPQAAKVGQLSGSIITIMPYPSKYGFISTGQGKDVYFNPRGLRAPLRWHNISIGQRVRFDMGQNEKGPMAINIHFEENAK